MCPAEYGRIFLPQHAGLKSIQLEMNSIKSFKFATLSVIAVCATTFASCSKDDNGTSAVKFNPSTVSIVVGGTQKVLTRGGNGTYTAKSGNEKTATATVTKDTIFVKGVKAGKTTIAVTDSKNITGSLPVTIFDSLKVGKSATSLVAGKSETIAITGGTTPYTATSKDSKIATAAIKNAQLTINGVAAGSTTVTVTDKGKLTATVKVTVTEQ